MGWTLEQQRIFEWFANQNSHLVVCARAGTGKTSTIIEGLRHAPERRILVTTFGRDAVKDLRTKIKRQRLQPKAQARTINSLGHKYVDDNWGSELDPTRSRAQKLAAAAAERARHRRCLYEDHEAECCCQAIHGFGSEHTPCCAVPPRDELVRSIANMHCDTRVLDPWATSPDAVRECAAFPALGDEDRGWTAEMAFNAAFDAMTLATQQSKYHDFADQLFLPLRMDWVRPLYDMVVIDEAQDLSVPQLVMLQRACHEGGRIVVVGDNRQAIYSFRGADTEALQRLSDELDASQLGLKTTFRCPLEVVGLAQKLVPDYVPADTVDIGRIERIRDSEVEKLAEPGDYVLSRVNGPLMKKCLSTIRDRRIAAKVLGDDLESKIRPLIRQLEPTSIGQLRMRLSEWKERALDDAEKIRDEKKKRRKIAWVLDIEDTIRALAEDAGSLSELYATMDAVFASKTDSRCVVFSTVHKIKGQEAQRVFVLDWTLRDDDMEEENIQYVAMTRTKHTLFLAR